MKCIADAGLAKTIDEITINDIGIPSIILMERAASAVCECVAKDMPAGSSILAVCGKGNNGADGIAAARLLNDKGYKVHIYFAGEPLIENVTDEAALQYKITKSLNIPYVKNIAKHRYDAIIDGLFGVGLSRNIEGIYERLIKEINNSGARIYSVDIPSGINATDARVMGTCVKADVTITFGLNKAGLMLYPGCSYAGEVIVDSNVFPCAAYARADAYMKCPEPEDLNKIPVRVPVSNKGTYGHVLVIAGSRDMCGAAYLSAKAAYRTGCGLVKILTHENNRQALCRMLPEAIIDVYDDAAVADKEYISRYDKWADCVVIGPGLGMDSFADELVKAVLKYMTKVKVIDADALNIIAENNMLKGNSRWKKSSILTPHLKEMSRLTGNSLSASDIHNNIIAAAGRYSGRDMVLVLKDARTVTAYNGKICINNSGNDGMATAGSGDVLTGIIAALAARGMNRYDAAWIGVYIHGMAGDIAAGTKNRYSMMAEDIIEGLCGVMEQVLKGV